MAAAIDTEPFAAKQFLEVNGHRMAYIDEGDGDAIVFQHGNPTSSYLWRNVMPHLQDLGRLVACDLLGMGDSAKLEHSGPGRYNYAEQRDHLHGLWDALDLGDRVILVLHDWGSALGFDWANRHRDRVRGIAYMEAIVTPLVWADWPAGARRDAFHGFRSPAGEDMILEHNVFVERILPSAVIRPLTETEMTEYRRPRRARIGVRPRAGPATFPSKANRPMWRPPSRRAAPGWPRARSPSCSSTRSLARS